MKITQPKVPKLHLRKIQKEADESPDLAFAFPSIAMTVSTCEKPGQRKYSGYSSSNSSLQNNAVNNAHSGDEEEVIEESKEIENTFSVIENVAFDSAQQTESLATPELDEK
jgi:hypothetical protein